MRSNQKISVFNLVVKSPTNGHNLSDSEVCFNVQGFKSSLMKDACIIHSFDEVAQYYSDPAQLGFFEGIIQ